MDRLIATSSRWHSLLSTHKVLRNTYSLLSLTLAFPVLTATANTLLRLPAPGLSLMLVGFYGLLFLTHRVANKSSWDPHDFPPDRFYKLYAVADAEHAAGGRRGGRHHTGDGGRWRWCSFAARRMSSSLHGYVVPVENNDGLLRGIAGRGCR